MTLLRDGYWIRVGGIPCRPFLWHERGMFIDAEAKERGSGEDLMRQKVPSWDSLSDEQRRQVAVEITKDNRVQEKRDRINIVEGVILELKHPEFATRSCEACKKWWYDDDGTVLRVGGRPLRRDPNAGLLCDSREGCPVGKPDKQKRLTPKNREAWKHFREFRAVGLSLIHISEPTRPY